MKTLEEAFRELLEADQTYLTSPGEARARGIFLLGAQAVLESIRTGCPSGPDPREIVYVIGLVNEEIGKWLGMVSRGLHDRH